MGISVEKSIKLYIGTESDHFHEIFVIPHSVRRLEWPGDKTICLANIPPYISEENLKKIFSKFGNIEKVAIFCSIKELQAFSQSPESHRNPKDFRWKTAYIAFSAISSVEKVLKAKRLRAEELSVGVGRWTSEYKSQYPSVGRLQEEINSFMELFDREERSAEQEAQDPADEDGWIQVSRKSTKDAFKLTEKGIQSVTEQQEAKKSRKELKNFYRFQVTESKKRKIFEMRKKFQEDKEKVEKMKSSRRFRPF